jgi:lipopolysaccharide heptosyltransferase II
MGKYDKILIFELNWMGDILFSFPFLRAIRKACPRAHMACVAVPRYAGLLARNPWIDLVHVLSDERSVASFGEKISFTAMIRKEGFDACFFLKPSRTKAIMAALAGIPERIGFGGKDTLLTKTVDVPDGIVHRADQILSLARALGVTQADEKYEYFFSREDIERADEVLKECGGGRRRIVAVNPGGNWPPKRWPEENFKLLIKRVMQKFDDIEVMITGADKDRALAHGIVKSISDARCYTVAGKTGINELAALFARSVLVVSADSGPLHLASATGVPTIGLFGPTSPEMTGPRGRGKNIVIHKNVGCEIPCYVAECKKSFACMEAISVDDVFSEAERMLS